MHVFIGFLVLIVTVLLFILAGYLYANDIKVSPFAYLCLVISYALYSIPNAIDLINK